MEDRSTLVPDTAKTKLKRDGYDICYTKHPHLYNPGLVTLNDLFAYNQKSSLSRG